MKLHPKGKNPTSTPRQPFLVANGDIINIDAEHTTDAAANTQLMVEIIPNKQQEQN